MITFLTSLQNLLITWANSKNGANMLASQPRNASLATELDRLKASGKRITGIEPNSDGLGATLLGLLS